MKSQMNIVIAGHVDHGKSTIIGRLLADTNSLPEGKLEQIKHMCEVNSKPFEYAFLLDALKDEQSQGITIDSARVFFKTEQRDYIIIDAPGHIEFLKNMVSGASRAEAALLVIDAKEGVQENSRRHGYMISMLGIKQLAVLVNKMDLVDYDKAVYEKIVTEYTEFLKEINVNPVCFIPVSGREGDNIASVNGRMNWYTDKSVLDLLDSFPKEKPSVDKPFRMPVQDVYKFTNKGDDRRIVTGTIESGSIKVGDEVVFYPSGKRSKVKTIESFNTEVKTQAEVGYATGFTLEEQIYLTRGELATRGDEKKPEVGKKLLVNLFWLGRQPFRKNKDYHLKLGTSKIGCRLTEIKKLINASSLSANETAEYIAKHDVAECVLTLNKALAFDRNTENSTTSRFVIVDDYEIAGGGIIVEAVEDKFSAIRENVILRNYKWEKSHLSQERRAEKYSQKSSLLILTGSKGAGKKEVAKLLEEKLFEDGKFVYFLGIGNVKYGIDADLAAENNNREEHLRRLSEVAYVLLDTGLLLIITARELTQDDLEIIKTAINPERITTVWVGDDVTTDISYDLRVPGLIDVNESVKKLKSELQEKGIIFKVW
ncbi:MAG: GTP-binding protein [Melioribacteraceae bacterium]|nr:adenylyl-sulfate kinase [Melioribacteraceae bacterium]MDD3559083.1 GTP-binding protein [Melioribacteraceae bacterium]